MSKDSKSDHEWQTKVYKNLVYCVKYCIEQNDDRKMFQEDADKLLPIDKLTEEEFSDMLTVLDTMLVD